MSLVLTRIQNFRVDNPYFDKNMTRPSEYGALDLFIEQSKQGMGIITPELIEKAKRSMGTSVEMPVIDYDGDVTVSNIRACDIADDENTSRLVTLVFATYAVGFTMVPGLYNNNSIGYDHDFSRKMEKVTRALLNALDQAAVAVLSANKTQVFKNDDLLIYTQVANVIEVPWDLKFDIMSDINVLMRANDYPGTLHIVGNPGTYSLVRKMQELGTFNAINKDGQWIDKTFHFTNNIVNEDGHYATFYAVESGNVGMVTRSDTESLASRRSGTHQWDIIYLPVLDLPVDFHYYESVGNQSAIAGDASAHLVCNVKEHYGFAIDVAFLVSYNSDPATIANPIIEVSVARSTVNPANAIATYEATPIP